MLVLAGAVAPVDDHQAGMIPGLHGSLGNELFGQEIIKISGTHGCCIVLSVYSFFCMMYSAHIVPSSWRMKSGCMPTMRKPIFSYNPRARALPSMNSSVM